MIFRDLFYDSKHFLEEVGEIIRYRDLKYWQDAKYYLQSIKDDLKYPFRYTYRGIKNLITWTPVIWEDRQWDHCYLYDILYKKLDLMEKFFADPNLCVSMNHKRYARQIRVCKNLVNIVRNETAEEKIMEAFYEKYGHSSHSSEVASVDSNGRPLTYEVKFEPPEGVTAEVWNAEFKKAMKASWTAQKRYDAALWRIIGRFSKHWWD